MGMYSYEPSYEQSWAIIIGINAYHNAGRLDSACNDATVLKNLLIQQFGFEESKTQLLLDADATYANIRKSMHQLVCSTGPNDRVLIYYAGHGCTLPSYQRDKGFIVPVEGNLADTSTLLPWDELYDISLMMEAKHAFFIMDACYGGLFGMRKLQAGSKQLLSNMMSRYARQFLTAGKANELVADGGGPRVGHSVFTGHLLDVLEGGIESGDGILSANLIMSHIYGKVAREVRASQAPHFGSLAGDGDFFFRIPESYRITGDEKVASSVLVEIGSATMVDDETSTLAGISEIDKLKEYIADPRYRIRLNDLVTNRVRITKDKLREDSYPVSEQLDADKFAERLRRYETDISELTHLMVVLCRWASSEQRREIEIVVNAIAGRIGIVGGNTLCLALRHYPMSLLLYAAGIASIESKNYQNLAALMLTPVVLDKDTKTKQCIMAVTDSMLNASRMEAFKLLNEHKQHYTPYSEYMYKVIQPIVDDTLLLGGRYDELFDYYEITQALAYSDIDDNYWGHPGRFAWKYRNRSGEANPFRQYVTQAVAMGEQWPLLKNGFFSGSLDRFKIVAERYEKDMLQQLVWH